MPKSSTISESFQTTMFDLSDESISLAADSPARISRRRAKARGSKANNRRCGGKCCESLTRLDLIGYSLKMYLLCECEALTGCSMIWKDLGTPAGRKWWVLRASVPPINGIESGSWGTPKKSTGDYCYGKEKKKILNLQGQVKQWPTPRREDSEQTGAHSGKPDTLTSAGRLDQENISTTGKPRGSLNSAWVMQLMGWPEDYAAELTRHCLEWQETLGATR